MTAPGTGLGVMQLGDQVVGDRQEEIDGWWADSLSVEELWWLCRLHGWGLNIDGSGGQGFVGLSRLAFLRLQVRRPACSEGVLVMYFWVQTV